MKNDYLCPHCKALLNIYTHIVLSFKKKNRESGVVFFHSDLGNYETIFHDDLEFDDNERVEFYCPVCNADLGHGHHENLAKIIMRDTEGEHNIVFSKVYGEKCTYKISEEITAYGEDSGKYVDFDDLSKFK